MKNKNKNNSNNNSNKLPFVSICTPTFNRRPFIPMTIKCIENQNYPKDKIEWIIVDDGTDPIEDLVTNIPYAKYIRFDKKISLGKKRNIANNNANGDIIVYMDDDDYYPPDRIIHVVDTLRKNPKVLCAGSSEMYIFFKEINEMHKFGPYGVNHATAATFAFKKELLKITSYDENAELAEEKHFLKNYTIPLIQLDPMKTILVVSHEHNSFDKKNLLYKNDPKVNLSNKKVSDFIKEKDIEQFFMEDIHNLLKDYEYGKPENKPELLKQMNELTKKRKKMIEDQNKNIEEYNNAIAKILNHKNNNDQSIIINELINENKQLKEKVTYLENKIAEIIRDKIKQSSSRS